ncbi:hypothetical protein D3C87_980340 [compost metagenome]
MLDHEKPTNGNVMKIKFSNHALQRVEESHVNIGSLKKEIQCISKISGKLCWKTKYGVLILEKIHDGLIIVKTFIARYKYKGKQYHKGCRTF